MFKCSYCTWRKQSWGSLCSWHSDTLQLSHVGLCSWILQLFPRRNLKDSQEVMAQRHGAFLLHVLGQKHGTCAKPMAASLFSLATTFLKVRMLLWLHLPSTPSFFLPPFSFYLFIVLAENPMSSKLECQYNRHEPSPQGHDWYLKLLGVTHEQWGRLSSQDQINDWPCVTHLEWHLEGELGSLVSQPGCWQTWLCWWHTAAPQQLLPEMCS